MSTKISTAESLKSSIIVKLYYPNITFFKSNALVIRRSYSKPYTYYVFYFNHEEGKSPNLISWHKVDSEQNVENIILNLMKKNARSGHYAN